MPKKEHGNPVAPGSLVTTTGPKGKTPVNGLLITYDSFERALVLTQRIVSYEDETAKQFLCVCIFPPCCVSPDTKEVKSAVATRLASSSIGLLTRMVPAPDRDEQVKKVLKELAFSFQDPFVQRYLFADRLDTGVIRESRQRIEFIDQLITDTLGTNLTDLSLMSAVKSGDFDLVKAMRPDLLPALKTLHSLRHEEVKKRTAFLAENANYANGKK